MLSWLGNTGLYHQSEPGYTISREIQDYQNLTNQICLSSGSNIIFVNYKITLHFRDQISNRHKVIKMENVKTAFKLERRE